MKTRIIKSLILILLNFTAIILYILYLLLSICLLLLIPFISIEKIDRYQDEVFNDSLTGINKGNNNCSCNNKNCSCK